MKYVGVDYGQKRTGIAVSDPEGRMAFPRRTIVMSTREAFFGELLELLAAEKAEAVVVGLPLHTDGTPNLTTRQVENFVQRLKRRTTLPVYWMEEVLTSFEAEADLREAGRTGRGVRALIDQQAAVRILQTFLNQPEPQRRPA